MMRSQPSSSALVRMVSPALSLAAGLIVMVSAVMPFDLERTRHLLAVRSGDRRAFHGHDGDALGGAKERHGIRHGARLLGAVIPGDQDIGAERARRARRRDQHRAAAFEQRGFQRDHGRALPLVARPRQNDHVEDPAIAADEIMAARRVVLPRPGQGGAARRRRAAARCVLSMNERNSILGLPYQFGVVLLHGHHGQPAVGIHGHEIGHSPAAAENPRCSRRISAPAAARCRAPTPSWNRFPSERG